MRASRPVGDPPIESGVSAYREVMTGRWANLALVVLVPLATVSGFAMFLVGSGPVWAVAVFHAALALAVVVLIPWKRPVVRRGLARVGRQGRGLSLVLVWLVATAVLSGVAHVVGLVAADLPVTSMQLHVGAGLLATPVTIVHARQRPVRARATDLSRRAALRACLVVGAAAGLTALVQSSGALVDRTGARRSTGSFRLATSAPSAIPVTSWLFDVVPEPTLPGWRLTTSDGTAQRQWTADQLAGFSDSVTAVLDCTGGWWTEQVWTGVRVARLVPGAPAGTTLLVSSATGYSRRLPLTDDLLLATSVAGQRLSEGHGAPARLVVPGRRGYHWVKWVSRVEVVDGPWWAQPPLPLR